MAFNLTPARFFLVGRYADDGGSKRGETADGLGAFERGFAALEAGRNGSWAAEGALLAGLYTPTTCRG